MDIDFTKNTDGLVPVIIQDNDTKNVLMLGYMNQEAYLKTLELQKVTFYSRTKKRLWTKGETSGNFLKLVTISPDCDKDSLLIRVEPMGPTCHKGTDTCWAEVNTSSYGFLTHLEQIIAQRQKNAKSNDSYIASLFEKGLNKIAQKVGEEAVEVIIEAKDKDQTLFVEECADLLFHYLILLRAKSTDLEQVIQVLKKRH